MNTLRALGAGLLVVLSGCSDGGSPSDGGGGDSGGADGGKDSGAADTGGGDAGFSLNGCTDSTFMDNTGGNATLTWDQSQSFPMCITIAAGARVTWNGPLSVHPLAAFGGDMPSPIMTTSSGTTATFTFASPGNFGFHCQVHSSMKGVIRVK